MQQFDLGNIVQILLLAGGIIAVYVKSQVKMKELDMKFLALEARVKHVEDQDEKIMQKLEEIGKDINEKLMDIKLELQNKQNK